MQNSKNNWKFKLIKKAPYLELFLVLLNNYIFNKYFNFKNSKAIA